MKLFDWQYRLYDEFDDDDVGGGEGEGEEEPTAPEEPSLFLDVDERTKYKTAEEARKGFQNLNQTLSGYREFGSPEELKAKLERLKQIEESVGGRREGESDKDMLERMDPEQRKKWDTTATMLENLGFKRGESETQQQAQRFYNAVEVEFEDILEDNEIQLTESQRASLRRAVDFEMGQDSDIGKALVRAANAGAQRRFAKLAFKLAKEIPQLGLTSEAPSGEEDASKQNGAAGQARGADGKFVSKGEERDARSRKQAGYQKASELPKSPSQRSEPGGGGEGEKKKTHEMSGRERKSLASKVLDKAFGEAG